MALAKCRGFLCPNWLRYLKNNPQQIYGAGGLQRVPGCPACGVPTSTDGRLEILCIRRVAKSQFVCGPRCRRPRVSFFSIDSVRGRFDALSSTSVLNWALLPPNTGEGMDMRQATSSVSFPHGTTPALSFHMAEAHCGIASFKFPSSHPLCPEWMGLSRLPADWPMYRLFAHTSLLFPLSLS